ncbi:MAG: hypothetical protein ACRC23_01830 [Aeromonas jandaei]
MKMSILTMLKRKGKGKNVIGRVQKLIEELNSENECIDIEIEERKDKVRKKEQKLAQLKSETAIKDSEDNQIKVKNNKIVAKLSELIG